MTELYYNFEVACFRLFLWASRRLGVERASAFGSVIMRVVGPLMPRHHKVLYNLDIAIPERPYPERKRIGANMWGDFGRGLAEYAHLPEICQEAADSRIEFVDHFDAAALRREGRPIVFVAAHQANWNLPAVVGRHVGMPLSVLFRRRKNPYLEAVIERWRNQMPCSFIDADARAPKAMLDELKAGRCIGLFIDRRLQDGEIMPFFDVDTVTSTVAARLALKTGAAFVPVRVERLPNVRFRITLFEPIEPDPKITDSREAARDMTFSANRHFEDWIRVRPEQWLCTGKRWPSEMPAKFARARS